MYLIMQNKNQNSIVIIYLFTVEHGRKAGSQLIKNYKFNFCDENVFFYAMFAEHMRLLGIKRA